MVSADTKLVIERSKRIYAEQLRAVLEPSHLNQFVAIEPESGEYFLGDTLDEAGKSASVKYPNRLSHIIRIGHRAAFHMGTYSREWVRGRSPMGIDPRSGLCVSRWTWWRGLIRPLTAAWQSRGSR